MNGGPRSSKIWYTAGMLGRNDQLDAVSVWVLGIWAGALIMTGASAAIIFPEMREMSASVTGLILPVDEHWKYIAGRVQNRVFGVCDWLQLSAGFLTLALFIVSWLRGRSAQVGHRLWIARVGLMSVLLAALGVYIAWLAPAMQTDLRAFWAAIDAKNLEAARIAQASFDTYHPIASKFFSGMLLGVVALGLVIALGIGRGERAQSQPAT